MCHRLPYQFYIGLGMKVRVEVAVDKGPYINISGKLLEYWGGNSDSPSGNRKAGNVKGQSSPGKHECIAFRGALAWCKIL